MYFVGIDLVEIGRIKKGCENKRFIDRVYSPAEQELFCGEKLRYGSLAGNWAAKEAFSKALGTGVRDFLLTEVEVLRDELGAPFLRLSGRAAKHAEERGLSFSVSITHTKELAQAIVIGWTG
ncbi:holo-[acyl-carrier protein] synthase [Ruminococcaceae bacterium FB2012]|nr:holo-[acyl-carrier protein] synthase [Ruminococcaceae bacterium FB2012]